MFFSKYCLTAGADCAFGLWDVCTGELIRLKEPRSPDRVTSVGWNCGDTQFLVSTFGQRKSYTMVYNFDKDTFLDPNVHLGKRILFFLFWYSDISVLFK